MMGDFGVPDFMVRALLAGIGVAIIAGALGVFVVWRRMAYFGEALAHSSLLGVVLGIALGTLPWLTVIVVSVLVALVLYFMDKSGRTTMDSAIGVIAHGSLAIGLVLMTFVEEARLNLFGYLFGDVLSTTSSDLLLIGIGGIFTLGVLAWLWDALLSVVVNEEVAKVEGVSVARTKIVHLLLLAIVVATAMKVVGVLLIVALLIIPASTARQLARSPEQMVMLAMLVGVLSVIAGLGFAYHQDVPAGPAIVAAAVLLFLLSLFVGTRPIRMRH